MTYVPKILSGIDIIDKSWGGMYQGGSYMCYGHASSGRGLIGMLFLQMGVLLEEKSLFLSPGKPQDWMIQAASVNFDLEEARQKNQVRLVWIPASSPKNNLNDAMAARAIEDLVKLIHTEKPERVLINDFMPFLQFHSFNRFRQVFEWMMGQLEHSGATVMLMMPDIINTQSQQIMEFMRNHMAGSMHVSIKAENETSAHRRCLVLWPGLGHVKHEVIDPWEVPVSPLPGQPGQRIAPDRPQRPRENAPASFEPTQTVTPEGVMSASASSVAVDSLRDVELFHEGFFNKLKKSFKQRATKKYKPFLLVALRMEGDQSVTDVPIGLDMLLPAIEEIVQEPDDILIDENRQRIIAFLPNKKSDNVQEFFESIQDKLREEYPSVADQLPHVVSAVVVPNGEPFETPEDFLAYALEGN